MFTTGVAGGVPLAQTQRGGENVSNRVFQDALDGQKLNVQTGANAPEIRATTQRQALAVSKTTSESANAFVLPQAPASGRDQPPAGGTYGKTDYVAADGDTLASVAAAHGQTVQDLLLANPELDETSLFEAGDTIAILDDVRLANAREIAMSGDAEHLVTCIRQEMLYATGQSATPADLMAAVKADILRLRPGDAAFAAIVGEQAAWTAQLWKGQGRTHEVMDPLRAMATRGDAAGLQAAVLQLFRTVAASTPAVEAIEGQSEVLLRYGPQSEIFRTAVAQAKIDYLVAWPAQAAQDIADLFAEQGPVAAASLLRAYTQAGDVDPLTAALVLDSAKGTIEEIIVYLDTASCIDASGAGLATDALDRLTIFGHLSAAADSASRSELAAETVESMARSINEQGYVMVEQAVAQGNGVTLALEVIRQSQDPDTQALLAYSVLDGIDAFKAHLRASASILADTGLQASEPALLWGSLLKSPEAAFEAVLNSTRPDGTTLQEALTNDIARISTQGYQMMRIITALRDYAPRLDGFDDLIAAGAMPAPDSDPAIELGLGSTPALLEALRSTNMQSLANGTALDPYAAGADISAHRPLGVGSALYALGEEVLGVDDDLAAAETAADRTEESEQSGWGSGATEDLYKADATAEVTQAISALLGLQLDLGGMTPDEISRLPLLQRTTASGAGLLKSVYLDHLQTFGMFNIIAAASEPSRSGASTPPATFAEQFAPVLANYVAGHPVSWVSRVVGALGEGSARLTFSSNVVTWSSTGGTILRNDFDDQDRAAYKEPLRIVDAAGLRPQSVPS